MTTNTPTGLTPRETGWDGTARYGTPDATLVLTTKATREEWLAARKTGFGASDASKLLGLSNWGDAYTVWADKTGRAPEVDDNEAMYWGREIEPLLRRRFTEDTGIPVRQSGLLRSKEYPFMLYTPDGLTADDGLLECKTFGHWVDAEWWNEDGTERVPDHAMSQVQQGMLVTGKKHAWVVGLGEGRVWYVRRVEADPELQALIIEVETELWEHVQNDTEPQAGPRSMEQLNRMHPYGAAEPLDYATGERLVEARAAVAAYRAASMAAKEAAAAKDAAKAVLVQLAGDHGVVTLDGEKGWTYKNTGAFNEARFIELANLEAIEGATAATFTIVAGPGAADQADAIERELDAAGLSYEVKRAVDKKAAEALAPEAYTKARARTIRV